MDSKPPAGSIPFPTSKAGIRKGAKRNTYTNAFRVQVIKYYQAVDSRSLTDTANHFKLTSDTVKSFWHNRHKYLGHENDARKVMRPATFPELEKDLMQFVAQSRRNGVPLTGEKLVQEARLLRDKHDLTDAQFKCSKGWLYRFLQRNGVTKINRLGGTKDNGDAEDTNGANALEATGEVCHASGSGTSIGVPAEPVKYVDKLQLLIKAEDERDREQECLTSIHEHIDVSRHESCVQHPGKHDREEIHSGSEGDAEKALQSVDTGRNEHPKQTDKQRAFSYHTLCNNVKWLEGVVDEARRRLVTENVRHRLTDALSVAKDQRRKAARLQRQTTIDEYLTRGQEQLK